jgi:hypothetical protein
MNKADSKLYLPVLTVEKKDIDKINVEKLIILLARYIS